MTWRRHLRIPRAILGVLALLALAAPLRAQALDVDANAGDLARAYVRFERAHRLVDVDGPALRNLNQRFDRVTRHFLNGRYAEAIGMLDAMSIDLYSRVEGIDLAPALLDLRASLRPRAWDRTSSEEVLLELTSAPPTDVADQGIRVALAREDELDTPIWQQEIEALPFTADLTKAIEAAPAGRYTLYALASGSIPVELGAITILDEPIERSRARLARRLDAIEPQSTTLIRAREIAHDRLSLLDADAPATSIGALRRDIAALVSSLDRELARLEAGESPYRGRRGDYIRPLRSAGLAIPLRLFVPDEVGAEPGEPRPLIVALHGASVDENMFFDGYGAGLIKDLARERGVIVASPLTYSFSGSPAHLDALVLDLARDYAIDRSRISVLGHSLGAIASLGFADTRSEALAAACCIAGFRPLGTPQSMCPTRIYLAEFDYEIFRPERVLPIIDSAIEAGLPLEPIVMPHQGHTLIVSAALPGAMDWLLTQRSERPMQILGE